MYLRDCQHDGPQVGGMTLRGRFWDWRLCCCSGSGLTVQARPFAIIIDLATGLSCQIAVLMSGMSTTLPQDALVRNIEKHVSSLWPKARLSICKWPRGPVEELGSEFAVLEISPTRDSNNLWVYCTAGTGGVEGEVQQHEFLMLSSLADERHVETLTMVSHYHRFESALSLGHIVTIGGSWAEGSSCSRLLMSLPYPFGPKLEWLRTPGLLVRFLWALPITPEEADFAKLNSVEELERQFDAVQLRYWDPQRQSVV